MKIKVSYQPVSEYEKFKDIVRDYERTFGTNTYTGNKDRDREYAELKKKLEKLRAEYVASKQSDNLK